MIRDTRDFTVHVEGECREALQTFGGRNRIAKGKKRRRDEFHSRSKEISKLIFNEGWWDKRKEKIESNKLLLFRFIS